MTIETEGSPRRLRSPPYPFIPLAKAIERVSQLYPKALHHQVGLNVLADAWGYGLKSSGLIQTAAALMQFRLLMDEGSGDKRKYQLTKEAVRIIQDADQNSEKRRELVRRAALAPKIHQELWRKYKAGNVSDVLLRNYLMFDRADDDAAAFSSEAAAALVSQYKATISFAEIEDNTAIPFVDGSSEEAETKAVSIATSDEGAHSAGRAQAAGLDKPAKRVGMNQDVFSLDEGDVVLQWPAKLSRASYEDLEAWAQIILRKIKRAVSDESADEGQK